MAKYILKVESNCNIPARDAEFNQWYNDIHIPDVLETPGFIRATRYENIEPAAGQGKYFAIYEIETNDINATMKANAENIASKRAQGRFSELITVTGRGVYRQMNSRSK